jgi:hypothetical protein
LCFIVEVMLRNYEPTAFRRRLRRRLYQYQAQADTEHGHPATDVKPLFSEWTQGVFPLIRAEARSALAREDQHDFLSALDSSQCFAINLLLPFRLVGARPLEQLLQAHLNRSLLVKDLFFEFVGPTHVLCETAGPHRRPDEHVTSVDVAVLVEDDKGRTGIILIEIKLAEGGFSKCNGRISKGNRRKEVCESAETMFGDPSLCYLTRPYRAKRDRRYWSIFEQRFGSLAKAFPGVGCGACPFAGHMQQPMRNHALALGLVQEGFADFAFFGLVHHDDNPDVPPLWDAYCEAVAEPEMLFRIPAGEIVKAVPQSSPWWREWARYMHDRFGLG